MTRIVKPYPNEPERLYLSPETPDGHREYWFGSDEGGIEYIRADLVPTATTNAVTIKPLVWRDLRGDGSLAATTTIGLQYFASGKAWGFRNYPDLYPVEGGIEAATAEAEADYQARILPLIDIPPETKVLEVE